MSGSWRCPFTLGLLVAIVGAATIPEFAGAEDPMQPDGHMVPVFDMELHVLCTGDGEPTVLLEAGLGANYLDWSLVQPRLSETMRACSYDRAGAGFSGKTARARTVGNMNEELHELLRVAHIHVPCILVGHSFGGMLSMAYARHYPEDVSALVLLDAMHPDQFERFAAAGVELPLDARTILGRTPVFASTYHLPPSLHARAIALSGADKARVFVVREMSLLADDARAVREAGYPRLPARIVIHGRSEWDTAYPDGRMERAWREMQADLARALGAPSPSVAPGSSHQIALDNPASVVQAVTDVAGELRR